MPKRKMIVFYTIPQMPKRELRYAVVTDSEENARKIVQRHKPHANITRVV